MFLVQVQHSADYSPSCCPLQWASKHGPIFRCFFLRQPVVVIQDIDLAHQVMVKHFKVGCTDSTA